MKQILFDIIIPTFNQSKYTIRCLESIKEHTTNYRVIWIDNGSRKTEINAVKKVIKDMPHFAILNNENLGFVKAINQGIATSTAPYLVFQNNDTEVTAHWTNKMMLTFTAEPNIGIVGCVTSPSESWQSVENVKRIFNFNWPEWGKLSKDEYNAFLEKNHIGNFEGRYRIVNGMVAFFCTMVSHDVIRKIGYLSEEYGIGLGDDDDLCYRARASGYKIAIALDTFVFHNHRTTFKALYTKKEIKGMQDRSIKFYKEKFGDNRIRSSGIICRNLANRKIEGNS